MLKSLLFWMSLWTIASILVNKNILLPSPISVLTAFANLASTPKFYLSALSSMLRVFIGYATAAILGTLIAYLNHTSPSLKTIVHPMISVIKATPVASFIILALVWLNKEIIPSFISFLMVFPIFHDAIFNALETIPSALIEVTRVFNFSPLKRFKLLTVPSVMPKLLNVSNTSLGHAWKAGIAAEVLCSPSLSIGRSLNESKLYLNTEDLFAWTILVICLSIILESLLRRISRFLSRKYHV